MWELRIDCKEIIIAVCGGLVFLLEIMYTSRLMLLAGLIFWWRSIYQFLCLNVLVLCWILRH